MKRPEGEFSIWDALSGDAWQIGYCHEGEQRGSYLLLWPMGGGLWDLTFSPNAPLGKADEDVYLVSRDDVPAVIELERARIELAPSAYAATQIALNYFPESRVAQAISRSHGVRTSRKSTQQSHLDGKLDSAGIWPIP